MLCKYCHTMMDVIDENAIGTRSIRWCNECGALHTPCDDVEWRQPEKIVTVS